MTSRAHHRQSGFTLVEMLLAITLMAMLLGLAYGGLRAAGRSAERGQELLAQTSRMRITHQFIRRQLNQMLPLAFETTDEAEGERISFAGSDRSIQFVGPMPGYLGYGGPQVQRIDIVDGPDGQRLEFSHALLQDFRPERLFDRDPVLLLDEVRGARFEFLGHDEEGNIGTWVSSWDQPEQLPVAVRLDLQFSEEDQLTWPLLATGVRVDTIAVDPGSSQQDYSEAIRDMIRRRSNNRQ